MHTQSSRSKQRSDKLVQQAISQQMIYPSRNPALAALGKVLKNSQKTDFSLPINEGDLFKTCYYEDIEPIGTNIERRVDPKQIGRCVNPTIGTPGGSLEEYVQYCSRDEKSGSQQCLLDQNQELEYFFKGVSKEAITTDLQKWLPFYCEVCQRYDTWDHPSHLNMQGKSIRRPIKLEAFDLSKQLQLMKIESQIPCEEPMNCALHQRSKLIKCAYEGQADEHLLRVNDVATKLEKSVQAELENIKYVIDHSMSYCMLRVILWGSDNFTRDKPTCLELYFCIRKILGQPPLDVHVLQRQPLELELEIMEVGPPATQSEDLLIVEGPPKPPKYFLSKSNVCDGGGIFTFTVVKRGTVIGSYLGELVSTADQSIELRSRYQQQMNHSSYSFQSKNNIDIDSLFYGNFTRMLNHMPCSMANCRFIKNETDVIIVAVRDIQPGEELFVDYGSSYTEPWKEEFDKTIKALRTMRSVKEAVGIEQPREQPKEHPTEQTTNGKTVEVPKEEPSRKSKAPLLTVSSVDETQQRKGSGTVCRKSNVTFEKKIEVIELDLE